MNTPKKPLWVKVTEIKKVTIWTDENAIRRARRNGYVKYRRLKAVAKGKTGQIDYLLNSIDPVFLNRTA